MATALFQRGNNTLMNNTPITSGLVFFNTDQHKIFLDDNGSRTMYGGYTDVINNLSSATSSNALSASATQSLFLQKTSVVNTKANALNVTSNNIPLGCLAFKETIGTRDISYLGNNIADAISLLGARTLVKLWENPKVASSSAYSAQNTSFSINVANINKYDIIIIEAFNEFALDVATGVGGGSSMVLPSTVMTFSTTIDVSYNPATRCKGLLAYTHLDGSGSSGLLRQNKREVTIDRTNGTIIFGSTSYTTHTGTNTWTEVVADNNTTTTTYVMPYRVYGVSTSALAGEILPTA